MALLGGGGGPPGEAVIDTLEQYAANLRQMDAALGAQVKAAMSAAGFKEGAASA